MKSLKIWMITALSLAVLACANTSNYMEQGGSSWKVGGTLDVISGGVFKLAGTTVTSSAAELNIVDGVTASAAEINLIDGSVAGTAVASKAAVLGANKNLDVLVVADGGLALGSGAGTAITSTAAELNKLDDAPFLVTTDSTTPASGSCAAQFTVKNAAGSAVAVPVSLRAYLTTSATGLTHDAAGTSIAVLTNGALTTDGATPSVGPHFTLTTTAAGLIGLTLTSGAGTYYVAFVMPNGKLVMSGAIVVNA